MGQVWLHPPQWPSGEVVSTHSIMPVTMLSQQVSLPLQAGVHKLPPPCPPLPPPPADVLLLDVLDPCELVVSSSPQLVVVASSNDATIHVPVRIFRVLSRRRGGNSNPLRSRGRSR